MDLSGRWEFSFDRDLNGQLVPTSLAHEVIFIMLDERNFVGRLVFPPDDPSRFTGLLTTTSQGTLFSLRQVNEQSGYQALYIGKLERELRRLGIDRPRFEDYAALFPKLGGVDELLAAVGFGDIATASVATKILDAERSVAAAAEARVAGIFTDLAGPDGDFRLTRIR